MGEAMTVIKELEDSWAVETGRKADVLLTWKGVVVCSLNRHKMVTHYTPDSLHVEHIEALIAAWRETDCKGYTVTRPRRVKRSPALLRVVKP